MVVVPEPSSLLSMAPPSLFEVLPEKVESVTVTVLGVLWASRLSPLSMAPPS